MFVQKIYEFSCNRQHPTTAASQRTQRLSELLQHDKEAVAQRPRHYIERAHQRKRLHCLRANRMRRLLRAAPNIRRASRTARSSLEDGASTFCVRATCASPLHCSMRVALQLRCSRNLSSARDDNPNYCDAPCPKQRTAQHAHRLAVHCLHGGAALAQSMLNTRTSDQHAPSSCRLGVNCLAHAARAAIARPTTTQM